MRLPIALMLVVLIINLAVDAYIYVAARRRFKSHWPSRCQLWSALVVYIALIVTLCLPRRSGSDDELTAVMWLLFGYFSILIPKLLFVIIDLIAKIPQLFKCRRLRAVSCVGGVLAVAVFVLMWWGALINRFRFQQREVTVEIAGLPEAFDGYRIVQFSDLHSGTYGHDTTYVARLVDRINALDADAVMFTGDIVNRRTEELLPFVGTLSRLHARDGVFSILGNHDYGDYSDWSSPEEKRCQFELLDTLQTQQMHWNLLRNEHAAVYRQADSIVVIGVENVGDPPFQVYGSLPDSYPTLADANTKILLSHNPAHWVSDIADNDSINIALTLSGHTHAMQIEMFGWSPAVFRYPTWGGLYNDNNSDHQLYVNIGIGTVGIPMRLGATPELTVITLRRKNN